MERKDENLERS